MHETRIDLKHNVREPMVGLLNARLADAIDLKSQLKQAHWNVKGPGFIALHELFDRLATEVDVFIDDLAERTTSLGGVARGTLAAVTKATTLPAYGLDLASGKDHLQALAGALAAFGAGVRAAIDNADEAGDKVTADLFTGIGAAVDKQLWLIEAHLQSAN